MEKLWKFELEKPMSVQMLMNYVRNIEDNVESSEDNRILPCEIVIVLGYQLELKS